jgi:hypothetical protein
MNDVLSVTRPFTFEVLVCLVMLMSMAVGTVFIGVCRLIKRLMPKLS